MCMKLKNVSVVKPLLNTDRSRATTSRDPRDKHVAPLHPSPLGIIARPRALN